MNVEPNHANTASPHTGGVSSRQRKGWLFARDLLVIVVIAVLASVLIKTFLVRSFYIPSGSMEQTLQINDRILVNQLEPTLMPVSRGDVIVFKDPGGWLRPVSPDASSNAVSGAIDWVLKAIGVTPDDANDHLVKRVIGLPGDHVVCCNPLGQLTVNDIPLNELAYINTSKGSTTASQFPFNVTVPANSLWVMGDNRDNSEDSRYHQDQPGHGFVPYSNVTGRAEVVTWPISRWTVLDNHSSVFDGITSTPPDG